MLRLAGAAIGLCVAMTTPAAAQSSRYGTFDSGQGQTQALVEDLRALINEADRGRAADPLFLRDLRELADRFDNPWRTRIIFDDFSDGDYTRDPAWTVLSGSFAVDARRGLLSRAGVGTSGTGQETSAKDPAVGLIAELLSKSLSDAPAQESRRDRQARSGPAEIALGARITNAFSLTAEVAGGPGAADFEFIVYQGARRDAGYRLVLVPGRGISLTRLARGASAVIADAPLPLAIADGGGHIVQWTRAPDGRMVVRFDGVVQIEATDRGLRGPFDGLSLITRGGEYRLASLAIDGAE